MPGGLSSIEGETGRDAWWLELHGGGDSYCQHLVLSENIGVRGKQLNNFF